MLTHGGLSVRPVSHAEAAREFGSEIRSVPHSQAARAGRRDGRSAVGVAALAGLLLTSAVGVRADVADLPNSFVAVELPAPSGWTGGIDNGLVMDLNQQGVACGWADDGTNGQKPFVFDPTVTATAIRGTTTILPLTYSSYTYGNGVATAITEEGAIGGSDYPTIVGYVYDPETISTPEIHRACYWQWSSGWQLTVLHTTGTYDSEAWGISNNSSTLTIGGHGYVNSSGAQSEVFRKVIGGSTTWYTEYESWCWDMSKAGPNNVGSRIMTTGPKAFYWTGAGATTGDSSLHPASGYAKTEVLGANTLVSGMTTYTDLCGWGLTNPQSVPPSEYKAILWRESPQNVINFDPLSTVTGNNYANDLNDEDEVVGTIFDMSSGDSIEAFLWVYDEGSSTSTTIALTDAARFPYAATEVIVREATCINDAGWIGGCVEYDGDSDDLPCLFIPTDADNNGVPDFRDIITDERADTDPHNSVPDDFEGMRVGLYGAALGSTNRTAQNTITGIHAVRFMSDYEEVFRALDPEDTQDTCANLAAALADYGEAGKEIIYMIRSTPSQRSNGNSDYLPPYYNVGSGNDTLSRNGAIGVLALFANQYAHCIDYIQFGNEFIGAADGPGTFYMDFDSCEGPLLNLSGECLEDSDDLLFKIDTETPGWYTEQFETALAASALAGRPLRFVGPAIYQATIRSGVGGDPDVIAGLDDKIAKVLTAYFGWANTIGAAVDLHVHYTADEWNGEPPLNQSITESIDYLLAPEEGEWPAPASVTCLEWSPIPDPGATWWDLNKEDAVDYFNDPPILTPTLYWNEFVADWLDADDEFNNVLHLSNGTDDFLDVIFGHGFLHACYGNFTQNQDPGGDDIYQEEELEPYAWTALFATDVVNRVGGGPSDDKWVDWLRDAVESAAGDYEITSWVGPHEEQTIPCPCEE